MAAIKGFSIFVPNVKVGDKATVKVITVDSVSADAKVVIRSEYLENSKGENSNGRYSFKKKNGPCR